MFGPLLAAEPIPIKLLKLSIMSTKSFVVVDELNDIVLKSKFITCKLVTGIVTLLLVVLLLYEYIGIVLFETVPLPLALISFLIKLIIKKLDFEGLGVEQQTPLFVKDKLPGKANIYGRLKEGGGVVINGDVPPLTQKEPP